MKLDRDQIHLEGWKQGQLDIVIKMIQGSVHDLFRGPMYDGVRAELKEAEYALNRARHRMEEAHAKQAKEKAALEHE